jgi:hypothetical protein
MVLHRGERRAEIVREGGARPKIILPPLKDLGYEKQKEKKKQPTDPAPASDKPAESTPAPITVPIPPPSK